jgi:hypothetical protein
MDANYGPLSHWFNALIFRVAGVGFMHLVWANLVIYVVILALIYLGLRIGWGRLAAFAGSLAFVMVFSFNQIVGIGNYNFVSPYSHETTHGFLLVLILIHLWASWLREPRRWKVVSAGLCCGLCVLLKVEVLFVAGIVTAGALLRAFRTTAGLRRLKAWFPIAGPFLLASILPSVVATLIFWLNDGFTFGAAFSWANIAWTGLFVYKNIVSTPLQMEFMGFANSPANLAILFIYGGLFLAGVCGLAVVCRKMKLKKGFDWRVPLLLVIAGLASYWLTWFEWGVTFPAFLSLALFIALRKKPLGEQPSESAAMYSANMRWLFFLAAVAFLARMCLNPRIYHYGFCQAALAGVVIVATAFRSLPDLVGLRGSNRDFYLASLAVFFGLGLWKIQERSNMFLSLKTEPIGEGADMFYSYSPQAEPTFAILEDARKILASRADCGSLLVIPEGVMLNYLLRKPVPIRSYNFNPYWLNWRDQILDALQKSPPDYVVLISRDMREYGMNYFGDSPEHGAKIFAWIRANYANVWRAGGNPLDMNQRGAIILQKMRKAPAPQTIHLPSLSPRANAPT